MNESKHELVFSDDRLVGKSASHVAARTLYGSGFFTTIAIFDSKPFLWDKHWQRLGQSAAKTGIDLSNFSEEFTKAGLTKLIAQNEIKNGRARVTFLDESAIQLWTKTSRTRTSLSIITSDTRPLPNEARLTISPHNLNSTSPLAGVKSCNYLEKILAKSEAKRRGFDEALQLNERGEIASASMANCFWLKDGRLFTPSLKTGCLAGTTREFVLENVDCDEVEVGIDELRSADDIFLTSAGIGIVQIAEFDGRKLNRTPHAIMGLLPPRR
jgi:branched-subunit amino acid aminotransferase/4-amino-4-deoxychorismate lyase